MKLPPDVAEAVGIAATSWAETTSALPLTITKNPAGAIFVQSLPKQRYTKTEFAAALNMSRPTFTKLEKSYCIEPAKSDGRYDRETVEDVKRWLRNEETINRAQLNRRFPDPR